MFNSIVMSHYIDALMSVAGGGYTKWNIRIFLEKYIQRVIKSFHLKVLLIKI